jgi:hypothetical protein
MSLFKELQFFVKEAKVDKVKINKKIFKNAIKQFVLYDITIIIIGSILIGITLIFSDSFKEVFLSKNNFSEIPFLKSVFYFCLIAPIIEELTFRLGLKISKLNISIFLGFNIIAILKISGIIEQTFIIRLLLILCISIICFLFLKDKYLSFFKINYPLFLYFNILFFGFVHIGNYSYSSYSQYLFVPVLVFTQIFLGIYLSYSRLRFGFFFALFIHIFHNLFYIILGYVF